MVEERAEDLTEHCRDQLGDDLRAVYTYGRDEHRIVYTREDVEYGYTKERLRSLLNRAHDIHQNFRDMRTGKEPLGAPEALMQVFEYAIVIQFVEHGIAVAIDKNSVPEMTEFVDECTRTIREESS